MISLNRLVKGKSHLHYMVVWLSLFSVLMIVASCTKDEQVHKPFLLLKTGQIYTADQSVISVGGTIRIGVIASGAGSPLTYIRIERITGEDTVVQVDRGFYVGNEGLDADYSFAKDTSATEIWRIMVMNADRDTAVRSVIIYRGAGSDYNPINYFQSVILSFQDNHTSGHFLDLDEGMVYDEISVAGKENTVDILGYYYVTSGLPSPTLTCPGYTAAVGYYPQMAGWTTKNNTLYDYFSTDNNLVSVDDFDSAANDSLLISAYKPDKVSGNCKYCYSGKVIPFKTQQGKYGLIKVIRADDAENGTYEIAVKIQQ